MIQIVCYVVLMLIAMYFISQTAFKIVLIAVGMALLAILALMLICMLIDWIERKNTDE